PVMPSSRARRGAVAGGAGGRGGGEGRPPGRGGGGGGGGGAAGRRAGGAGGGAAGGGGGGRGDAGAGARAGPGAGAAPGGARRYRGSLWGMAESRDQGATPLVNFGGNVAFAPRHRYTPSSEAEVLEVLDRHAGGTIRVIGSLHSWSDDTVSDDAILDLRLFDQ